jgi:hypothetical protein
MYNPQLIVRVVKMFGRFVPKDWPQSTKQNERVLAPSSGCVMLQENASIYHLR